MNRIKRIITVKTLVLVAFLLCIIVLTTIVLTKPSGALEKNTILTEIPIQTGELRLVEERKDVAGNTIQIWNDEKYSYYYNETDGNVNVISANTNTMEEIVKSAKGLSLEQVPSLNTETLVRDILNDFFPEYNLDSIKTVIDTESGNPIELFQFKIKEYYNDILLNTASISLSYDGQLTFLHGSHNTIDTKKDYSVYEESNIIELAFKYLQSKKEQIEYDINSGFNSSGEEEYYIATEDMVLPDGVKIGDVFKTEKLPLYEMVLNSVDDMNVSSVEKMAYKNTVAWLIEFSVNTSWGKYTKALNPLIHLYIDAATGEVLEMNSTDAG